MSGGGGDKSRAGFSSRVVVITETDGMDQPGRTSRESDKVAQLEARTRAYGNRKRIYMECTVSTEEGRTWSEYQQGTRSRIVLPCPHCAAWVTPEREHLIGWADAPNQHAARQSGTFACPDVPGALEPGRSHSGRTSALGSSTKGSRSTRPASISGAPPPTDTLGFRWSAVNNLFLSAGDLAADEWKAKRSPDEENAEKEMRQFVWCLPVEPTRWEQTALEAMELASRVGPWEQGIVPTGLLQAHGGHRPGQVPGALDRGGLVERRPAGTSSITAGSRSPAPDLGVEPAILVGLRSFRDMVTAGWPLGEPHGKRARSRPVWVDAGYMTDVVYAFCREIGHAVHARSRPRGQPTAPAAVQPPDEHRRRS